MTFEPKNLTNEMDMESITTTETEIVSECCICYENIQKTNNCTTPCGHTFCFNCIVKSLNNNNTCPCCRSLLGDSKEEDDDETYVDIEEEESDDESDDGEEEENEEFLETFLARFQAKGYILKDALCMLAGLYSNKNKKYNNEYYKKTSEEFDTMLEDMVNEDRENKEFGMEDKPTMAKVENIVVEELVMMEVD